VRRKVTQGGPYGSETTVNNVTLKLKGAIVNRGETGVRNQTCPRCNPLANGKISRCEKIKSPRWEAGYVLF